MLTVLLKRLGKHWDQSRTRSSSRLSFPAPRLHCNADPSDSWILAPILELLQLLELLELLFWRLFLLEAKLTYLSPSDFWAEGLCSGDALASGDALG
jgi:hypothetical protein